MSLVLETGVKQFLVRHLFDGMYVSNDNDLPFHLVFETSISSPSFLSKARTFSPRTVALISSTIRESSSRGSHLPTNHSFFARIGSLEFYVTDFLRGPVARDSAAWERAAPAAWVLADWERVVLVLGPVA